MKNTFCTLSLTLCGAMAAAQTSPYINKVYEYRPAPGQFVNVLPEYEEGDDANDMRLKAEDCIANHEQTLISLGGWGGYVVFGFDHMVPNVKGEYDLKILGNAFYASANPNPDTERGGSAEPGIVMVSYDANHNGKPDDEWYELAGSEHGNPLTRRNYECTYYRTEPDHVATPDNEYRYLTDTTYIRWIDNCGASGYMAQNSYHRQDYYPRWISDNSLTFSGTRLRDNGRDESGNGQYFVLYCFDWGYADNQPNFHTADAKEDDNRHVSEFKIDWAVDKEGKPVELPGINFVKVYTGVHQQNGWLGEASTEIMDAWDLHMIDANGNDITLGIGNERNSFAPDSESKDGNHNDCGIFDMQGRKVSELDARYSVPAGVYIMRRNGKSLKIYIH